MNLSDIKYIKVRVGVRYWEDAEYNGVEDVSLCDATEPIKPNMPFAVSTGKETCIAPQGAYDWVIDIDPSNGNIIGWEEGNTANIQYKSCDDNTIYLYGENDTLLKEYNCYVPSFLCIGDEGYGDYVIMEINSKGHIMNFRFNEDDINELEENCF